MQVDGHRILTDPLAILQGMYQDEVIGFDIETTGLSPWRNQVALIQLYGEQTGTLGIVQTSNGFIPSAIVQLFDRDVTFVGHNITNFDIPFLRASGVKFTNAKFFDTLVGEALLLSAANPSTSKSLRATARRRLGEDVKKTVSHGSWDNATLTEEQVEYAARDVLSLPALRNAQIQGAKDSGQEQALEMEMELVPAVAALVYTGLPLHPHILRSYVEEQKAVMQEYATQLQGILGSINLNSPIQLRKALANIGVYVPNTSSETLVDYYLKGTAESDICKMILDYRHPAQRVKVYNEKWINEHIIGSIVHANFWQLGAETGRFTCTNPNLQQIPKDGRKIFGHNEGYVVVSADFSQIEVRIAAALANETNLLSRLEEEDIHTAIGSDLYHVQPEEVSSTQRKNAKAATFTLIFGGSAQTVYSYSRRTGGTASISDCVELEEAFFTAYPQLLKAKGIATRMARRPGALVLRLPNNFRRILVGNKKSPTVILNTMVQGTAAIGMKLALIEANKQGLLLGKAGAVVHDEIVAGFVEEKVADDYAHELVNCMVRGMQKIVDIPIIAKAKITPYWSE